MTPEEILAYLRYKQSCEGRKAVMADNDHGCRACIDCARLIAGMIWFIEIHGNKLCPPKTRSSPRLTATLMLSERTPHGRTERNELFRFPVMVSIATSLIMMACCPPAKASPITHAPIVEQPMQYWHTQWVPSDGGVYLMEVYAPALPQVEPEPYVFVDIGDPPLLETPEPGTWGVVAIVAIVAWVVASIQSGKKKGDRWKILFATVEYLQPEASTLAIIRAVKDVIPSGAVYVELSAMHEKGILSMRTEHGGPERGFRDRVFYSIARKALEETK